MIFAIPNKERCNLKKILRLLELVSKRDRQIQSEFDEWKFFNLAPLQHKVVLLVLGTAFAVGF